MKRLLCLLFGHQAGVALFTSDSGLVSDGTVIVKNCMITECARCGSPIISRVTS